MCIRDREKILRFFGYDQSPAPVMNLEQVQSDEELGAFIAGAFLACGSMVDPGKSYHLEFVVPDRQLCEGLIQVLSSVRIFPKSFERRSSFVAVSYTHLFRKRAPPPSAFFPRARRCR